MAKKTYNFPTKELFKSYRIVKLNHCYLEDLGKLMYKSINNYLPIGLEELFVLNETIHNYNTRNVRAPHMYVMKTNIMLNSFLIQSPKLWMLLSDEIKESKTLKIFVRRLRNYLFSMDNL